MKRSVKKVYMATQYEYINIYGKYYCSQQNPLLLYWYLSFYNKSLKYLPSFKRNKPRRIVRQFMQHQLRISVKETVLRLPFFGNISMRVHRGYRLFNFRKQRVIKVFDSDISIEKKTVEMNAVQKACKLSFTPHLFNWNIEQGWYEEEMIDGYLASGAPVSESDVSLKRFDNDIAPCIEEMILSQPLTYTTVGAHLSTCKSILESTIKFDFGTDSVKVDKVQRFIDSIIVKLKSVKELQVLLVLSHGDFSLVNMLSTKNGIKVIDWESLDNRTMLSDLFNYFFTELYYKRVSTNMVPEINDAVSSLKSRMSSKSHEISDLSDEAIDTYRRLYYIERLATLASRKRDNQLLKVILRSIDVFQEYETMG